MRDMKKKSRMKELTSLTERRKALQASIRDFNPVRSTDAPAEVKIKAGDEEINFRFENGKCVAAPPDWRWAIRWTYQDLSKYWENHRERVVLSGQS